MPDKFCFDWFPGVSGQLEILSPPQGAPAPFQYRYTPPFRATLRPPLEEANLGPAEMDPIHAVLEELVQRMRRLATSRKKGEAPAPGPPPPEGEVSEKLRDLGSMLLTLVLPDRVHSELQRPGMFLEIGTDEALLSLPWELLFDGQDFLCLKSSIGRFVHLTHPRMLSTTRPNLVYGHGLDALRVLVVSVPKPEPKDKDGKPLGDYPELTGARAETAAIAETLGKIDGVVPKVIEDATWSDLFKLVQTNHYHIVHFNGHAQSNPDDPKSSGIVLQDKLLTTGQLTGVFSKRPPVFCFLNACETTQLSGATTNWRKQHNLYGLASAILEIGSYLLGSCWKIDDDTAATFAACFYESFLGQSGTTLGDAIRLARLKAQDADDPDNIGWASYTYYGDPRLILRRQPG